MDWITGKTVIGAVIAAVGAVAAAFGIDFDSAGVTEAVFKLMEVGGLLLSAIGVRHAIAKATP